MPRVDLDPVLRRRPISKRALPATIVGFVVAACRTTEPLRAAPPPTPTRDIFNMGPSFGKEAVDQVQRELRQRDRAVTLDLARRTLNPEFLDRFNNVLEYHSELMIDSLGQFASVGSMITLGTQQQVEIHVENNYRALDIPERSTFDINVLRPDFLGKKPALVQPDSGPNKSGVSRIGLDRLKQVALEIFVLPENTVWKERDFIAFRQGQYQDGRRVGITVIDNGSITLEIRSEQFPSPQSPLPPLKEEG